jgi:hypothetical protein
MLARSFRLVAARLIPQKNRYKQSLLALALILAGCGGSGAPKATARWQVVAGAGAHFQAPAGWHVEATTKRATATHDSELVQVSSFPLVKPYRDALFGRVATELRMRMQEIARQTGGKVTAERTVVVDGIRSHAYDVDVGDHVDAYTFVLHGKREHLLLCRRKAGDDAVFCAQLLKSFAA